MKLYVNNYEYTDIKSVHNIESRKFKEIDVIGNIFLNLIAIEKYIGSPIMGYSPLHSHAITDSLGKIAEFLRHISMITEKKLPITFNKQEGIFLLSYVNNIEK